MRDHHHAVCGEVWEIRRTEWESLRESGAFCKNGEKIIIVICYMFYGWERVNMGKRILSIILAGIILMLPMQYVSAEEPDFIIEEGVLSQYNGTLKMLISRRSYKYRE